MQYTSVTDGRPTMASIYSTVYSQVAFYINSVYTACYCTDQTCDQTFYPFTHIALFWAFSPKLCWTCVTAVPAHWKLKQLQTALLWLTSFHLYSPGNIAYYFYYYVFFVYPIYHLGLLAYYRIKLMNEWINEFMWLKFKTSAVRTVHAWLPLPGRLSTGPMT